MLRLLTAVVFSAIIAAGCGSSVASPAPTMPATPSPSPPYRLVDVGERRLAIDCRGEGPLTVVLIAGLGVLAETWAAVMEPLAAETRVCRYDRPGLGESSPPTGARTSDAVVADLAALLDGAGERPPYVLVGASLGGLHAQLFARTNPDDVAGVVFVDAIHPEFDARIERLLPAEQVAVRREELGLNQEGVTFEDILADAQLVRDAPSFPDVPVAVLRHGIPFETTDPDWPAAQVEALWEELAEDLAGLGEGGDVVVAESSGHRIAEDQPDLLVDTVLHLVDRIGS